MQEQSQVNKLKDLCFKKRWIHITVIVKLWNYSERDIISDHEFLLSILNAFTDGTEEHYLKYYKVNNVEDLQNLYQIKFTNILPVINIG